MLYTLLGPGDTALIKEEKNSFPQEAFILVERETKTKTVSEIIY